MLAAQLPTPIRAQGTGKRLITPQDLWAMKRLSNPELSPDGRTVAIVVQEWSIDKNKSTSNIWLVPVARNSAGQRCFASMEPRWHAHRLR